MYAVIDVGSNTIRMLTGDCRNGKIKPHKYYREITRLAGDFSEQSGLSDSGMRKSLTVLKTFHNVILVQNISQVRVVGTAALRRAKNQQFFIDKVFFETGLKIEVITGDEEALLTTTGALSVVKPVPETALVVDIGGGSTELICVIAGKIQFQTSYSLGVVRLCEEFSSDTARQQQIDLRCKQFAESLTALGLVDRKYQLIGTAGTITTLAAMDLQLKTYDALRINNHELSVDCLEKLQQKLKISSALERELMVGMEQGRGDLILPGLQIILSLMHKFSLPTLKVSDSGLLEGVILGLTDL